MIVLSNLAAQTLQPGQAVTFNNVLTRSSCCDRDICFNKQSPQSAKLRRSGAYEISFSGNITGAANAVLQMAVALGGQPLVETAMNGVPAAAGNLVNIHTTTILKNCCCDMDRVSVINTGTTPVTLAPNSAFVIHKLCD